MVIKKVFLLLFIFLNLSLSSCQTKKDQVGIQSESNKVGVSAKSIPEENPEDHAMPVQVLPNSTPSPVRVKATVFQDLPEVPILMYHRFNPNSGARSEQYKVTLTDLDAHIAALYDAGYSLVSLEDWLRGEIILPDGRKPLIITIDDLFYADQISLDPNGDPATYSGIGRIWQFYQEHPDFNFHLALFYNFGDKGFANRYENGAFYIEQGWEMDRAKAIAWGIQNGAVPYNHFYNHPNLKYLSPEEVLWHLEENEAALEEALNLVGESALIENLSNILALPYVVWPETDEGKQVLYNYRSPNGAPVSAILEANDGADVRPLPAPFAETFDPQHVKRLNAVQEAVDAIVVAAEEIPSAQSCDLGELPPEFLSIPSKIKLAILQQIRQGNCTSGYYTVGQFAFFAEKNNVIQLSP